MSGSASVWDEVLGHRVHARVSVPTRPGLPLVLVHGLGVSSRYMLRALERLGDLHPVSAPDLPGFGLSEKPPHVLGIDEEVAVLRAWMDARGLARPVLIANSMGCQLAVSLAAACPGRVAGLVLLGPTYDAFHRTVTGQLWGLLRTAFEEPLSLLLIVLRDYLRAGVRRVWRSFRLGLADPLERRLPRVRVPTLVLRGGRDRVVSRRWAEQVAALLPEGRYLELPEGAHAVHYDAVDAMTAALLPFLAALERGVHQEILAPPFG